MRPTSTTYAQNAAWQDGTPVGLIPSGDSVVVEFAEPLPDYIYDYSQIGVVALVQSLTVTILSLSCTKQLSAMLPCLGPNLKDALISTSNNSWKRTARKSYDLLRSGKSRQHGNNCGF